MANFYLSFRKWQKQKEKKKKKQNNKQRKELQKQSCIKQTNARKRIYTYTRKYKIITNFNFKPLFKPSKALSPTKWTLVPT